MKFRLWHVILTEIANMSPGQKNLESCQTNVLEQSLSSPLAFPILVNIKPYQKYTKITQNAVFNFFWAKFGVLPFLQECPTRSLIPDYPDQLVLISLSQSYIWGSLSVNSLLFVRLCICMNCIYAITD